MKLIIPVILFLSCIAAHGQRKHHPADDKIVNKGDSLKTLYAKDKLLKAVNDTLPLYTRRDETSAWRDMQLVTWFYDDSNSVKKITFRNGEEGSYSFYFEGPSLRKVNMLKRGQSINLQCYFTDRDNQYAIPEIEQKMAEHPEEWQWYELLKTGKTFLERFKALLSNKIP